VFLLDGTRTHDEASFLATVAEAMAFPEYFGRNWAALDECIQDLSWVPATGYVLRYDGFERFARTDPAARKIALDVFRTAVKSWQDEGIPMDVLLRGGAAAAPGLPTLRLPPALRVPSVPPA
jgi:RNAse (barnase) inhibitor barstar